VTERNKWVGGALSSMIVAQLVSGIYSVASVLKSTGKLFDSCLFACRLRPTSSRTVARDKPGPIQDLCLRNV
jgi:hypothetical protein